MAEIATYLPMLLLLIVIGGIAGVIAGLLGVGGGIVVHGQVLDGANGIAGEWGHNPLPLPGGDDLPLPACYCGRCGCVEAWLSGPALAADHARQTGECLSAAAIAVRAAAGDEAGCGHPGGWRGGVAPGGDRDRGG